MANVDGQEAAPKHGHARGPGRPSDVRDFPAPAGRTAGKTRVALCNEFPKRLHSFTKP